MLTASDFANVEHLLLDKRAGYLSHKVPQPLIRIQDKENRHIARVMLPTTWECEEQLYDEGTATIVIEGKDNEWLRNVLVFDTRPAEDLHLTIDPDPDKPHDWLNRWSGKIETITDEDEKGKPPRVTIKAVHNIKHLSKILIAATPLLPPAVQPIKMYLDGGSTASVCARALYVNLMRIYEFNSFWPIPRNWADPMTWLRGLNPLNWPIQVFPINSLFDQSRWGTIAARWKDAKTVFTPTMRDAGVAAHAYMWFPGDPPPYSEVFGDELGRLLQPNQPTIIIRFRDDSGVTGPTGTAADGGINLFAATLDDMITEVLYPVDGDGDGETDPFFRKLLGVQPHRPPYVYRDVGYGGAQKVTRTIHKSQAISIVTGGKSPAWLNQAITFAIRYGLSQLAQVINYGLGAYEQYGAEGLDNLYQGQLDDTLLAFMNFIDPRRSLAVGPYGYNEHFETGQGSAFTISSVQTTRQGWWVTRPYVSFKFDIGDVRPYKLGSDLRLGSRVQAEHRGVLYVDQIMAVKRSGDRKTSGRPVISFGDDSREEDPVAQGFRSIGNLFNFAAMLAGSGEMF